MNNVKNHDDMNKALIYGNNNRSVGETAMNRESSRSHCIFSIYIEVAE